MHNKGATKIIRHTTNTTDFNSTVSAAATGIKSTNDAAVTATECYKWRSINSCTDSVFNTTYSTNE